MIWKTLPNNNNNNNRKEDASPFLRSPIGQASDEDTLSLDGSRPNGNSKESNIRRAQAAW